MASYSKGAGKEVEEAMHEMKEGKLKTGTGKKVTSRKQAVAIGLSEAREKGKKVPAKKTSSRKNPVSNSAAKKGAAKKSSAKKSAGKKGNNSNN